MPLANRDFDPQGRLRQRPGQPAPAPSAPPPVATPGAPKPGGPTPQQLARRARNGVPVPAPAGPSTPSPTPAGQGTPGARQPRAMTARGPNTAADPLPPEFSRAVKAGKFSEAQARKNWARSLGQLRGPAAGTPTPSPSTPVTTPPPPPAPGVPAGPAAGMPVGGALPSPLGGSPGAGPGGTYGGGYGPYAGPGSPLTQPGTSGGMSDYRDPMMTFLSAVPMMNINRDRQINDALSQFGDTGNRWSSTAMGKAGEIGAESAMAQNTMLADLLRGYSEGQENRALQAGQLGLQASGQLEDMARGRVQLPYEVGMGEQRRQDDFSKMAYDDFDRNRHGYLPMLLQAAMSQGAGSPGQIVQVAGEPPKPGLADWAQILGAFF